MIYDQIISSTSSMQIKRNEISDLRKYQLNQQLKVFAVTSFAVSFLDEN